MGVYSVILVTEMCKDLLWLSEIFLIIFFRGGGGGEGGDNKREPGFSFLCQTIISFIYLFIYLFQWDFLRVTFWEVGLFFVRV